MQPYGTDLAYLHDLEFGTLSDFAAPELLRWLNERGISEGRIIDLGCGSGRWTQTLWESGFAVLGIDLSPAMIELAKKRTPGGEFLTGSFYGVKLPSCRGVTCLGEGFNYQFEPAAGISILRDLFLEVFSALESGGLFVFDIAGPDRGTQGPFHNPSHPRMGASPAHWADFPRHQPEGSAHDLVGYGLMEQLRSV